MSDITSGPADLGTSLRDVTGLTQPQRDRLHGFGFTHVEQALSALSVAGVLDHYRSATGEADGAVEAMVDALVRAAPMARPSGPLPKLAIGALAPTPAMRSALLRSARPAASPSPAALPHFVNHGPSMPPLKDQGTRGTCVAFALTAVHEHASGASPPDYSEQFLYHETKKVDGDPTTCGTWINKAAAVLAGKGQCLEAVWRYDRNPPCNDNGVEPAAAGPDAAGRTLATDLLDPQNIVGIKDELAAGRVVGLSFPVFRSWFESPDTIATGRITLRIGAEAPTGGHAVCLVGYQDDPAVPGGGYFILRNSWFGMWGTQSAFGSGHGTIPYAYVANEGWEAVVATSPVQAPAE